MQNNYQVVDMRWGVRDEMTNEHMTTALCMTELTNCQRLSMGPNFIYFGAQKYGYRYYIITALSKKVSPYNNL